MTGYIDGLCDIDCKWARSASRRTRTAPPAARSATSAGTSTRPTLPLSANADSQGTRLFLNALFEADCVTGSGQPTIALSLTGDLVLAAKSLPVTKEYLVGYANSAAGSALAAVLRLSVPSGVTVTKVDSGGTIAAPGASWTIGSISGVPTASGDPPSSGSRASTLSFSAWGEVKVTVDLDYRVGASDLKATPATVTIQVKKDSDGDGVPDDTDPYPSDAKRCGDSDKDNCDDCSSGSYDPQNDGPDADKDGMCDSATDPTDPEADEGGCGCRVAAAPGWTALTLALGLALLALWRSRRRR